MSRVFLPHVITDDSALGGMVIERSIRNDQGTADVNNGSNFEKTYSSASNRKTFTISVWVKKCGTPGNIGDGDDGYSIFTTGGGGSGAQNGNLQFYNDDSLYFYSQPQPSPNAYLVTTRKFRDLSTWYHIVIAVDTTQGTASDRLKMYINGVQETSFTTETYPSQNDDLQFNMAERHRIGSNSLGSDLNSTYANFNGYFAEFNFIDGQGLDSSYFGFTDSQTGIWIPKRYEGTYGTNGFHLEFKDNSSTSALGKDTSGNGNDFTANGFSVTAGKDDDSMFDTPTNNFPTFNLSNRSSGPTISNGNLRMYYNYKPASKTTRTTFRFPKCGKYYYEWQNEEASSNPGRWQSGIINVVNETSTNYDIQGYNDADIVSYSYGGSTWFGTTHTAASWDGTTRSWYSPERAAWAVDCDTGNVWVGRVASDGTTQWWAPDGSATGNPSKLLTPTGQIDKDITHHYLPFMSWHDGGAASSTGFACNINFGQHSFLGTIPDGFKTLSSANIPPDPTINTIVRPQRFFETVTYTGNGGTSQDISSLEFQPDLIWFKGRNHGGQNVWIDSVRGTNKNIKSDSNAVEGTTTAFLSSFNPNGFTVGQSGTTNGSSETNVAWCWKAGGAAVSNSDGSITSSISANQECGFSIVTYTGTGSAATIGHGLGKTPKLIIVKNRTTEQDWFVNNGMIFNEYGKYYKLSSSSGSDASDTNVFPNTAPTSTVFSVGTDNAVNGNSDTYVAYVWSEIPGFSQFGYWTGNGSTDGTYVYTGFTPRMIIYRKKSDENWHILDTKRDPLNPNKLGLDPNLSNAEADDSNLSLDILGNGFKVKSSHSTANTSGTQYFYYTWAEKPGFTNFDTMPNGR